MIAALRGHTMGRIGMSNIAVLDKSETETYLALTEEYETIGKFHGMEVRKCTGKYHLNYDPNFCQLHLGEQTPKCNNGECDD